MATPALRSLYPLSGQIFEASAQAPPLSLSPERRRIDPQARSGLLQRGGARQDLLVVAVAAKEWEGGEPRHDSLLVPDPVERLEDLLVDERLEVTRAGSMGARARAATSRPRVVGPGAAAATRRSNPRTLSTPRAPALVVVAGLSPELAEELEGPPRLAPHDELLEGAVTTAFLVGPRSAPGPLRQRCRFRRPCATQGNLSPRACAGGSGA